MTKIVERLRARANWQRENWGDVLDQGTPLPELEEAAAVIEALTEALQFYADRSKYQHTGPSKYYPLADDEGNVARTALTRDGER
jgi:hypothetical protein